ncbi:MAG: restriction endonuclease subunit S [Enterococcus italicus]|uniref:restriction endonuclease subunit S n=1 Tax=Enterococcus italicus TaxID=246144 RepID=UPI00399112C6
MNPSKTPRVRFKGYEDEWEERKLGEVFQQTVEYIDPKEVGLELWSVTVENGLTPKSERYNREFLVKKNDKFKAIHPDEIVYNPMNMTLGSIGFNNSGKNVAVSGYYVTMKLNKGFDSKYFATWLPSPNAINLYKLYATGSLIERQRVQFPTLSGIKTLMPILNEQKQIGLFFKQLDDTIALHQRKLNLLNEQKKGFLQKMFPKNGEKIPEIRFAGFNDAWEERKLGDHAKYRRGSFPQPYGNKEWYDGEGAMPFVQVVDVTNKLTLVENTKQKISKLAQSKSVFVPKGKVVVTLQGSIGRVAITQYDSFVDRTLLIFEDYEKETDERFWAYTIQKKFEIEKLKAPGGTIKTITKEALSSFDVHLPKFEEQQKIGSFFKKLDDTIALHQRKIDELKSMKKSMLQKMFV